MPFSMAGSVDDDKNLNVNDVYSILMQICFTCKINHVESIYSMNKEKVLD